MNISVVICTCNRPETLGRSVTSVLQGARVPEELIVVDQSDDHRVTRDGLARQGMHDQIRWCRDEGRGLARARNRGWRLSQGDLVVFTDDDAHVDPQWLAQLSAVFASDRVRLGVAGGRILPAYEERVPGWHHPERWRYLLPEYDRPGPAGPYPTGEYPAGVSLAVRREVLGQVGGFDENLGLKHGRAVQIYGEDTALCMAAEKLGYRVIYVPDAVVWHPVPRSRQREAYLTQRLFSEGATYIYLTLRGGPPDSSLVARLAVRKQLKWLRLMTLRRWQLNRTEFLGEHAYLMGELYMLLRYGACGDDQFDHPWRWGHRLFAVG